VATIIVVPVFVEVQQYINAPGQFVVAVLGEVYMNSQVSPREYLVDSSPL
jgi:hypothetical protein